MAQKVLVIFGGVSTEYIVSLRSAYNIIGGLRQSGYDISCLGITPQGEWLPYTGPDAAILEDRWQEISAEMTVGGSSVCPRSPGGWLEYCCQMQPDCIFPAVHGINCEDGTLQGLLSLTGIPFVGSGVLASAACMDKLHAKRIFRDEGIMQCRFTHVQRSEIAADIDRVIQDIEIKIGFPCFLKPSNGGSSVGTCRATDRTNLRSALQEVSRYDREIIVEEFVQGRELEIALMGNESPVAGAVGEILTSDQVEYYDYQAKYFLEDGARVQIPASLDMRLKEKIRQTAIKAYKAIGCTGLARVDFFLEARTGTLMLNEINTLPGFTPISVFPKSFAAVGIELPQLVDTLCRLAIEENQARQRQEKI